MCSSLHGCGSQETTLSMDVKKILQIFNHNTIIMKVGAKWEHWSFPFIQWEFVQYEFVVFIETCTCMQHMICVSCLAHMHE